MAAGKKLVDPQPPVMVVRVEAIIDVPYVLFELYQAIESLEDCTSPSFTSRSNGEGACVDVTMTFTATGADDLRDMSNFMSQMETMGFEVFLFGKEEK